MIRTQRVGERIQYLGTGIRAVAPRVAAVGATYKSKVIGYGPIAYWALDDALGAGAAVCSINVAQNGTPANVTFDNTLGPDGVLNAPLFNGTTSWIDVQTGTFASSFIGK